MDSAFIRGAFFPSISRRDMRARRMASSEKMADFSGFSWMSSVSSARMKRLWSELTKSI